MENKYLYLVYHSNEDRDICTPFLLFETEDDAKDYIRKKEDEERNQVEESYTFIWNKPIKIPVSGRCSNKELKDIWNSYDGFYED